MGAPMTETVVDPATFKEMRNGQILAYVRDNLLRRADRIRTIEERLIEIGHASGWHAENRAAHDAMCAAAALVEAIIAVGKDQEQRGVKLSPVVGGAVEAARSSLIAEAVRARSPIFATGRAA
jgi:hypothetical protein